MKIDAWQMARKVGSVKKHNLNQSDEKCHLPLETVSVELIASLGLLYLSLNVVLYGLEACFFTNKKAQESSCLP